MWIDKWEKKAILKSIKLLSYVQMYLWKTSPYHLGRDNQIFMYAFIKSIGVFIISATMTYAFKELRVEECRYTLKLLANRVWYVTDKSFAFDEMRAQKVKNATLLKHRKEWGGFFLCNPFISALWNTRI